MHHLLTLAIVIFFVLSCSPKKEETGKTPFDSVSQDSLESISKQWKKDSLGCLRLRDPQKIQRLIVQLSLENEDSTVVIKYLGRPNGKNFIGSDTTVFYYFMDCESNMRKGFGYNLYCDFKGNKLHTTWTAILN